MFYNYNFLSFFCWINISNESSQDPLVITTPITIKKIVTKFDEQYLQLVESFIIAIKFVSNKILNKKLEQ